jgi:hypothetical protein
VIKAQVALGDFWRQPVGFDGSNSLNQRRQYIAVLVYRDSLHIGIGFLESGSRRRVQIGTELKSLLQKITIIPRIQQNRDLFMLVPEVPLVAAVLALDK